MKATLLLTAIIVFAAHLQAQTSRDELKDYSKYDFVAGENAIFEEDLRSDKTGVVPSDWIMEGGSAIVDGPDTNRYVSVLQYYTVMSPRYAPKTILPDTFTIEYDTWLDAGYDGNPGIQIHLMQSEQDATITPNTMYINCQYPGGEQNADTPSEIRGEKFFDRWNHIAIYYAKPALTLYVDQFKMFTIPDCNLDPDRIMVTGNASQEMKILMKNFRIAKNIPAHDFENGISKGVFITHAIRFDVNKSVIKPESMAVLTEIAKYLQQNPAVHIEIGGHTDSDGDDAFNMKLSQQRADAVKKQLISMGVTEAQLTAKGYGESKPLNAGNTAEAKAGNRRVEFTKL